MAATVAKKLSSYQPANATTSNSDQLYLERGSFEYSPVATTRMETPTSPVGPDDSFTTAPCITPCEAIQPLRLSDKDGLSDTLILDFSPNDGDFFTTDQNLYWHRGHNELSHELLFRRAIDTKKRLVVDLKATFKKLLTSKTRRLLHLSSLVCDLEPEDRFELRLTGSAPNKTQQISMTPWVWIRCDDKYTKRKIRNRLKDLDYLETPIYSKVHPVCSPAKLAHSTEQAFVKCLDLVEGIEFPGGEVLHTHVANHSKSNSSFGWICCNTVTRDSVILSQCFSRLGGLLRVDDSFDTGIITAHGMLDFFLKEQLRALQEETHDDFSSSDGGESDDESLSDNNGSSTRDKDELGYVDVLCEEEWHELSPFDTINFVAQARKSAQNQHWELTPTGFDTDYALLKDSRGGLLQNLINCYEDPEGDAWGY
ncbi:hypothetical protein F4677DRAFT_295387 [Hypoxylon crocopeplum]|nr:hypothetical protein F4677DRAFT_295387 [Hypoxylon crocopeplum]